MGKPDLLLPCPSGTSCSIWAARVSVLLRLGMSGCLLFSMLCCWFCPPQKCCPQASILTAHSKERMCSEEQGFWGVPWNSIKAESWVWGWNTEWGTIRNTNSPSLKSFRWLLRANNGVWSHPPNPRGDRPASWSGQDQFQESGFNLEWSLQAGSVGHGEGTPRVSQRRRAHVEPSEK